MPENKFQILTVVTSDLIKTTSSFKELHAKVSWAILYALNTDVTNIELDDMTAALLACSYADLLENCTYINDFTIYKMQLLEMIPLLRNNLIHKILVMIVV